MTQRRQEHKDGGRARRLSGKAFTLAVIPNYGGFKREWRVSYLTLWFFLALDIGIGALIAVSELRKETLDQDRKISADVASAWLARQDILEYGKRRITANLDELKKIGDGYFRSIFGVKPDLGDTDASSTTVQLNAKIMPLMSVMRLLTAREEAFMKMPIGIAIHSDQITSLYGSRVDPFGLEVSFHSGIDFAGGTGVPIYATADGVVVGVDDEGTSGLGKNVRILHKYGIMTAYGHMSQIATAKDRKVRRGDLLGFVGSTGRATGPHLHYEVRIKNIDPENYYEISYNPMPFIREQL